MLSTLHVFASCLPRKILASRVLQAGGCRCYVGLTKNKYSLLRGTKYDGCCGTQVLKRFFFKPGKREDAFLIFVRRDCYEPRRTSAVYMVYTAVRSYV